MRSRLRFVFVWTMLAAAVVGAQKSTPDTIAAAGGDITIVPIAHATVYIAHGPDAILIDPVRFTPAHQPPPPTAEELAAVQKLIPPNLKPGDDPPPGMTSAFLAIRPGQLSIFQGLPPATLILVTDIHDDHLDGRAIGALKQPTTRILVPLKALDRMLGTQGAEAIANGERKTVGGATIEAVPMYNAQPFHDAKAGDVIFHPKGRGNGYIVTLGGKRLYVAGDTGCTPEMKALRNIDVAFLPMNLPFTMPPSEAADCAKAFRPKIVYPYHYFESDPKQFESALKGTGIEVRIRNWYFAG